MEIAVNQLWFYVKSLNSLCIWILIYDMGIKNMFDHRLSAHKGALQPVLCGQPANWISLQSLPLWRLHSVPECRSPGPATRDSIWKDGRCRQEKWDSLSVFYGLPVYFKFKILFYTFTKTLGQRFDIFSSPSPRFIISINHCCSSNRVPASVILSESALSSIIYLL